MIAEPPKPDTKKPRRRWPIWVAAAVAIGLIAYIWVVNHRAGPGAAGGAGGRGGRMGAGDDKPVPVLVGEVKQADVPLTIAAIGTVEAAESVQVRAQITGNVVGVGFEEGQPVRRGQVLFRLDPGPALAAVRQAEAAVARDRAQLAQARADAARSRSLGAQGYISRQQAEQAGSQVAALEATVQAGRAQVENARVQLGYATIRSPIDGVAGARLVDAGNLARANDANPLVVINRVTPAMVRFAVPQGEIDRLRRYHKQRALKVTATPRGGAPHQGTLAFLENAVDAATGTLGMQARFPNVDAALVPGQFVDVQVTLTVEEDRVVAPAQAVLPAQDGHLAFVVEGEKVVQRTVKVARAAGPLTVVAEGLKPGEKVVTDGTLQLKDGANVEIRTGLEPPSPKPGEGRRGRGQGGGH